MSFLYDCLNFTPQQQPKEIYFYPPLFLRPPLLFLASPEGSLFPPLLFEKMKTVALFCLLAVALFQVQAQILPTSPSEPQIAFNDANACLKAIACMQDLGSQLIPLTSQDTDGAPWGTDKLAVLAESGFQHSIQTSKLCDSPAPYESVYDCFNAPGTNNGFCLENFLAQIDACVNAFLSMS